jgi:hypothetical protein
VLPWIKSTFLYQRATKNPQLYGMNHGNIDKQLEGIDSTCALNTLELCNSYIQDLVNNSMVSIAENKLQPLEMGRLMARFYVCNGLTTYEPLGTLQYNERLF